MKSFIIHKNDSATWIHELSFMDMVKLLFGREIYLMVHSTNPVVIRHQAAYDVFNLAAPKAKT